jgi:hypothetical protein
MESQHWKGRMMIRIDELDFGANDDSPLNANIFSNPVGKAALHITFYM